MYGGVAETAAEEVANAQRSPRRPIIRVDTRRQSWLGDNKEWRKLGTGAAP